ncbi:MAG TPA: HAD family hydrolase, partial [Thermoanaerobaculia bacterium]|nr:HAD family hydrolase [Thermoanaerobaculia bacterium]
MQQVVFFHFDPQHDLDRDFMKIAGDHRVGIVTKEPRDKVKALLKERNIDDLVEFIVSDSDAWHEDAAKEAGVAANEIIYVNSDRAGLARAEMYGIRGVVDPLGVTFALTQAAPDISGLAACTTDAQTAALDNDRGPDDETHFDRMLQRLDAAKVRLPPLYVTSAEQPFVASLTSLGSAGFTDVLVHEADSTGALLLDLSHSILQNGEQFQDTATDAFEEVVTDLYDGFLSAQDRKGIKAPDRAVLPPLVKWGNPDFGPYTWPVDATSTFNVQCAIVNLPPANAAAGLMAWAALAHETAGHDILHADHGLEAEIAQAVQTKLAPVDSALASYWSQRIDETASDVMGILNMGPAPAIGLISYFRALNAAFSGVARLRTSGPANDPHPARHPARLSRRGDGAAAQFQRRVALGERHRCGDGQRRRS